MKSTSLALALLFSSMAGVAHADCSIAGTHVLQQSNNITVSLNLNQTSQQLRGNASFYSTALKTRVRGTVSGTLVGREFNLKIYWLSLGRYSETGYYSGRVNSKGELKGQNYPSTRPQARTNWSLRGKVKCA